MGAPEGYKKTTISKTVEENFLFKGFKTVHVSTTIEEEVFVKGDIPRLDGKKDIQQFSKNLHRKTKLLNDRDLNEVMVQVKEMLEKEEKAEEKRKSKKG